jgi:uncharacterized protein YeaO (DUF488 family)
MPTIKTKRVYEPETAADGYRVLVDRLWPRGIKKENLKFDEWLKEVAPSTDLRKWFNHDAAKWAEFQDKYKRELQRNDAAKALKAELPHHKTVTLLYSARDEDHNQAQVLKSFLSNSKQ